MTEFTTGKRVLATLLSGIFPGLGQVLKRETRKAFVYLALFAVVLVLYWWVGFPETYVRFIGLGAVNIGAICLALIASLDAWLTGAAKKPRYLIAVPILAAFLGIMLTGLIFQRDRFRAYTVPSAGMEPSIMEHDRIVADKNFYETKTVKRGDVVVVLLRNNTYVVKRVLAVEGDVIAGLGEYVYLNGQLLQEPYAEHTGAPAFSAFGPIRVLPGKLFLMGDNRDMSFDSRFPQFGQINVERVRGKVLYIWFSRMPSRLGRKIE